MTKSRQDFLQAHGLVEIFAKYRHATARDRSTMILRSIMRNFERYGTLTDKQIKYAKDLSV